MPAPGRLPRLLRLGRGDSGSAAAELVLLTPLLVLMMLLTVAAGRLVQARLQVDSAAQQAARAASLARDPATATADATATATAALASENLTCANLAVSTGTSDFQPGGQVTVQVSCTVALSGLALLHLPGTRTLTSRFAAPIDVYRGTGP
jgi:Flp pilus assembly protein TadG